MNGFISKTLVALCLGGGAVATGGCCTYRDVVDPCYPQRYNHLARTEVQGSTDPQVNNGHVLDQTVWNYHFEAGTDKLNPGGMEHLKYLARRRPSPDPMVWLQTAQDVAVGYNPAAPDKFVQDRKALDGKRAQAVKKFLGAMVAGRPVAFEVNIHDPAEVGISGRRAEKTIAVLDMSYAQPYKSQSSSVTTGSGSGGSGTK